MMIYRDVVINNGMVKLSAYNYEMFTDVLVRAISDLRNAEKYEDAESVQALLDALTLKGQFYNRLSVSLDVCKKAFPVLDSNKVRLPGYFRTQYIAIRNALY